MAETTSSVSSDRPSVLDEPALIERDQILREFEQQFLGTVASLNVCTSIEGGWGMGRTALLDAVGRAAERCGYVVIRATGALSDRGDAFAVLRRLLESVGVLHGDDEEVAASIATILWRIARDGERGLEALGTAFGELLLTMRAIGPVLVTLDDAHLVDEATMLTLSTICQRVGDGRLWLVITTSSRQPSTSPLAIEELLVRHFVRRIALTPLSRYGVRELATREFEVEPSEAFVDALVEATGGRPAFVVDVATGWRDAGLAPDVTGQSELEPLRLWGITQHVLARLSQLAPSARDVLEMCAVGGASGDTTNALHLAYVEPYRSTRDLRCLEHVELLRPDGSLEFAEPVVRWAVLHELSPVRRAELHGRWANYLASNGAGDAAVVRHLLATKWDDDVAKKIRKASRRLLDSGDAKLARQCLRRLLDEASAGEGSSLWLDMATCEIRLGDSSAVDSLRAALARGAEGERVIAVALELMDELREWPEMLAEGIALLQSLSRDVGSVDPTSQLAFELGLTLLAGHPAQRNFDLARIEMCLVSSDHNSDTGRLAQLFVDVNYCERDSTATASEISERFGSAFVEHSMPVSDVAGEIVLMRVARLLLHSDQFSDVDEFLEVARRRAYSAGDVALENDALRLMVLSTLWQGSLERAEEALRRHDELRDSSARQPVVGSSEVLIARDRLDEALRRFGWNELDRIVDPLEYAKALVERGRLLRAAARADEALETFERAKGVVNRAGLNLEALVAWRPAMAEALADLGHWEQAVTLASEHLCAARSFGSRRTLGVALRTMATVTRESDARVKWLTEAIETLEGSPLRLELAGALIDSASLMVERGDGNQARALLEQGLTLASECKAARLVRLAEALLATLGAQHGDAGDAGVAFVYS